MADTGGPGPVQVPAAPPAPVAAPSAAASPEVAAKPAPWIVVDSAGERLGVAGALLLVLGAVLPWGGPSLAEWGPVQVAPLSALALALGSLALLQVASTSGKAGDVVTLGLAGFGSLFAAGLQALELAGRSSPGYGMGVALLGVAACLAAMEVTRREAGLDYARMAQRALSLVLEPRVQLALLKIAVPFALAGAFVFLMLEIFGDAVASKLGVIFVTYFFNPLGKEVAIPLALDGTIVPPALDPALTWSFIVFIDLCTALFFVWNYDLILHVPFVGRFFAYVERKGNAAVVRYKWIRRLAFVGLIVYATLPLEGTGAIGGSVVGRAIGLNAPRTFTAVVLGSIIRTSLTTLIVLGVLSGLGVGGGG